MGGGHGHAHGITYKGVTLHQAKRWHTVTGKGLCAVMWYPLHIAHAIYSVLKQFDYSKFWILYRAKKDGPVVLGWRHPWEGHDDHH